MIRLRVSRAAEREANDAAHWYNAQRANLGSEFLDELAAALTKVEAMPERFAREPTSGRLRDFRRAALARFPYTMIFEVKSPELIIVQANAHNSRRPGYWRQQVE